MLLKSLVRLRYALSARYRRLRYEFFWRAVGQSVSSGLWLDLGGGPGSYFLSYCRERSHVILVDIDVRVLWDAHTHYPDVQCVVADAGHLPFKAGAFACIFCNSVIEHVPDPGALASEIRRTGRRFFLQTPNGKFPLETHSLIPIPFYRYWPVPGRRLLCRLAGSSYDYVATVTYLSRDDLAQFFPSALIDTERVVNLVKSFYVIGSGE